MQQLLYYVQAACTIIFRYYSHIRTATEKEWDIHVALLLYEHSEWSREKSCCCTPLQLQASSHWHHTPSASCLWLQTQGNLYTKEGVCILNMLSIDHTNKYKYTWNIGYPKNQRFVYHTVINVHTQTNTDGARKQFREHYKYFKMENVPKLVKH